jgi:hypothetical protein
MSIVDNGFSKNSIHHSPAFLLDVSLWYLPVFVFVGDDT